MFCNFKTRAVHLAGTVGLALSLAANAGDISVLSAGAVKAALSEVAQNYQNATGQHIAVEYAPVGSLLRQLSQGAKPDLVVLTAEAMVEAERAGWALAGSSSMLGSVGVGVAVREHAVAPDISTPEAFKQALLAAKSITYMNPDKGTSGKHFAEVLRGLGISDAMKSKTTLGESGYVMETVARGEIELGIQQITEILPVQGVKLVGPLPEPLQKITAYTVALAPQSRDVEAVRAFLAHLRSAHARAVFTGKGFVVPQ